MSNIFQILYNIKHDSSEVLLPGLKFILVSLQSDPYKINGAHVIVMPNKFASQISNNLLYFCSDNMEKVIYYLLLERKERRPSSADVVPKAIRKEHAQILGKSFLLMKVFLMFS